MGPRGSGLGGDLSDSFLYRYVHDRCASCPDRSSYRSAVSNRIALFSEEDFKESARGTKGEQPNYQRVQRRNNGGKNNKDLGHSGATIQRVFTSIGTHEALLRSRSRSLLCLSALDHLYQLHCNGLCIDRRWLLGTPFYPYAGYYYGFCKLYAGYV